jgi:phosphocarrier protein NPr
MPVSRDIEIQNKLGLHARAATKLAQLAQQFSSTINIHQADKVANADSVMALLMLASNQGKQITVTAEGDDQDAALDAVCELISNRFEESE